MISTWTIVKFLACFCTIISSKHDRMTDSAQAPPKESYLSISIKRLASNMHEYVAKTKGNFVFSPYGLSHALVVLLGHAQGETSSEIRNASGLRGNDLREMREAHYNLGSLNRARNQSLQYHMKSLLAYDDTVSLFPKYGDGKPEDNILQINFTGLQEWTTKDNPKTMLTTKEIINKRFEIHGLIPMFLNSDYELKHPSFLANAMTLRISWDRFENAIQQKLPFKNIGGPETNVTMLTIEGKFPVNTFKFASILELPYTDEYCIYIILPKTPDKLKQVEDKIFAETFAYVYGMKEKHLQVTIPMFKLDTFFNLNEALKALGMRTAFIKGESELSEISKKSGAFLGDVLQRAVVEFGERSDIPCTKPNLVEKNRTFLVDRPFFFVIRSKEFEVTLFRGRVERID